MVLKLAVYCKGISLSQRKYIIDILDENGILEGRPAYSPMDLNTKFHNFKSDLFFEESTPEG